ncbi:hypothetical protein GCM10011579_010040 [Streptomyces albiflavescens]|uniref:Uncharacterized protein n=1 Tax=Streptomyces albiflavescens TaxID=1623582 RepID=A0A918CZJ4_9ACTN|nr:hypothetical protein GCM10011579_010040 [Streptomyces albiflavescens]
MLRLERDHAPHSVQDGQRLPRQKQLAAEGGPVEFVHGDLHSPRFCRTAHELRVRPPAWAKKLHDEHRRGLTAPFW